VTTATTYAEAVIQQCPDLDCALTKVCRDFAKCNINKDQSGFTQIVQRKVVEATTLLEAKGSKGLYHNIKFTHRDSNAMAN
jgi:N-acetylglutamate synthase/N-acetylornithine aminotransferase